MTTAERSNVEGSMIVVWVADDHGDFWRGQVNGRTTVTIHGFASTHFLSQVFPLDLGADPIAVRWCESLDDAKNFAADAFKAWRQSLN